MDYKELLIEATASLMLNKMRTVLATLGIVIGTGSVIALISLGQASQKSVEEQIQSLGSNLLTVMPGSQNSGNVRGAMGSSVTLTYEDTLAMSAALGTADLSSVKSVSPELSRRAQVVVGKNNSNNQIMGVTPVYAAVRNVTVATGSFLTDRDVAGMAKVVVMGPTAVVNLFGEGTDPVGQWIRIGGQLFKVIGVTASKGGTGFQNPDDMLYIPVTTAQKQVFGVDYISTITAEAVDKDSMVNAQDQLGYFLLAKHKIIDPAQADFSILSQQDILGAANQITGTLTSLLSGIAAISLVVGGIGIMNIMLVTVTERTREIGLRKALGAKNKLIVSQFLFEAILLTVAGGVLGTILGICVSLIITKIIGLTFTIAAHSVLLSLSVSCIIGIAFGWYPARKAASLQPIEALRYE